MDKTSHISVKKIQANNYEFEYLEMGKGPLIIALHGFPDNPWTFEYLIKDLAVEGYRVIAPYKRGFKPGDTAIYPIQHYSMYVQDLLTLLDVLKSERIILIGHDWGAGAVYGAAKLIPANILAIITMAIPLSQAFFTSYTDNIQQMKRSWYLFFFQQSYAEDALKNNDFAMIESLWKDWSPGWTTYQRHLEKVKETFRKEGSVSSAVSYYRQSFGNYQLEDSELTRISAAFNDPVPLVVPALYFHGENDGCIGVENVDGMEYLFAGKFEKHIIRQAGHFVHLERPHLVNSLIIKFLDEIR